MNICRPLIGFIISVKYFSECYGYLLLSKWSLFTRMFCCIYLGSEKCTGGGGGGGWGRGCLQKFSRLIYCGPGEFVFKVEKV